MPGPAKKPPHVTPPNKIMLPKEGSAPRQIEPMRTYRVPQAGETMLLRVKKVGNDTLTVENMQTGKVSNISRQTFQNGLNNGSIYVSSRLVGALVKLVLKP